MSDNRRNAVSVLLPTLEWGPVCEELADQLGPNDELLVLCDSDRDPVAGRKTPNGVAVCIAGEPEGCSGKANALAYGMERATNDRFVWSDADYERDDDWLDCLVEAGEEHGMAAVLPMFPGGGWWRLVEPVVVLSLGLQAGLLRGDGVPSYPWGIRCSLPFISQAK
jgi:hypothetical protein